MAKFRDATGRVVMRSTKQTVHREALKLAFWAKADPTTAREAIAISEVMYDFFIIFSWVCCLLICLSAKSPRVGLARGSDTS